METHLYITSWWHQYAKYGLCVITKCNFMCYTFDIVWWFRFIQMLEVSPHRCEGEYILFLQQLIDTFVTEGDVCHVFYGQCVLHSLPAMISSMISWVVSNIFWPFETYLKSRITKRFRKSTSDFVVSLGASDGIYTGKFRCLTQWCRCYGYINTCYWDGNL